MRALDKSRSVKKAVIAAVFLLAAEITGSFAALGDGKAPSYKNNLSGWKAETCWGDLSKSLEWNPESDTLLRAKLIVSYSAGNTDHSDESTYYAPGEIKFEIPGIGDSQRESNMKASSNPADMDDSEWNCEWDKAADIYTFTNKVPMDSQSLSGGFELMWELHARKTINGYHKEIPVKFTLRNSASITLPPLSINVNTVRDNYRLGILSETDGIRHLIKEPLSDEQYKDSAYDTDTYIWYRFRSPVDCDRKSRGLYRHDYIVNISLPDAAGASDILVKNEKGEYLEMSPSGDVVLRKDVYGDICRNPSYLPDLYIGFRKNVFLELPSGENMVTVSGHIRRLYNDENVYVESSMNERDDPDASLTFSLSDYNYTFPDGYIYALEQDADYNRYPMRHDYINNGEEPEPSLSGRWLSSNIYTGGTLSFYTYGSAEMGSGKLNQVKSILFSALKASPSAVTVPFASPSAASTASPSAAAPSFVNMLLGQSADRATPSAPLLSPLLSQGAGTSYKSLNNPFTSGNGTKTSEIKNRETYSMILGEDVFGVQLNDGTERRLSTEEYDILRIRIDRADKDCDFQIFYSKDESGNEAPGDYELLPGFTKTGPGGKPVSGNTGDCGTYELPAGTKACFVKFTDITGSCAHSFYTDVRLHINSKSEDEKPFSKRVDNNGKITSFMYMRPVHDVLTDGTAYEKSDLCGRLIEGNLFEELGIYERDITVYGEELARDCDSSYIREPSVSIKAKASFSELTGSMRQGFTSAAGAEGTIESDIDGELRRFSLFLVPDKGLSYDLYNSELSFTGSGIEYETKNMRELSLSDASVSCYEYQGRNLIRLDFDMGDTPLSLKGPLNLSFSMPVSLTARDCEIYGSGFSVSAYLMPQDGGTYSIRGDGITQDSFDIDRDGNTSEMLSVSSASREATDRADEWRQYVNKYVKGYFDSDAVRETVTRLDSYSEGASEEERKCSDYEYRLEFGLGSGSASDIWFFDRLEDGAVIALPDGTFEEIPSETVGRLTGVDTSLCEKKGMKAEVFYSQDPEQILSKDAEGWSSEMPYDTKAVAVHLDTGDLPGGVMETKTSTYITLKMRALSDPALSGNIAVNQFTVEYTGYDYSGDSTGRQQINSSEVKVRLLEKAGNLILRKADGDNIKTDGPAALSGAGFTLYKSDDGINGEVFCGIIDREVSSLGYLTVKGVEYGTYYYEETKAPRGYKKITGNLKLNVNGEEHLVTAFTVNGISEYETVLNRRVPGQAVLTKKDADNPLAAPVPGASYQLFTASGETVYTDENNNYAGTGITDTEGLKSVFITGAEGTLTVSGLPWGSYYFNELTPPKGYEISGSRLFFRIDGSLHDGESAFIKAEVTGRDTEKKASLLLKKTDSESGEPLSGAVFAVYKKNGGVWDMLDTGLKTNAAGELTVTGLKFGTYKFREVQGPKGYYTGGDSPEAVLDSETAESTVTVNMTNERIPGGVILTKTDKDDPSLYIEGAEFALYRESAGEDADERIKTDADGKYDKNGTKSVFTTGKDGETEPVSGLPWGDYYFTELSAPEGYELSSEKIRFAVNSENASTRAYIYVQAENRKIPGTVVMKKLDEETQRILLPGASFSLYKSSTGEKQGYSVFKEENGKRVYIISEDPEENTHYDYVTGDSFDKGGFTLKGIPWGMYYFEEVKAPEGYSVSAKKVRFTVGEETAGKSLELCCLDPRETSSVTITKKVNEWKPDFGPASFIYRITGMDELNKGREFFRCITVTERLQESIQFSIPAGKWKVEELPTERYLNTLIAVDSENTNIKNISITGTEYAVLDLSQDTDGTAPKAGLKFVNTITQYEKLSHEQKVINYIEKNGGGAL